MFSFSFQITNKHIQIVMWTKDFSQKNEKTIVHYGVQIYTEEKKYINFCFLAI